MHYIGIDPGKRGAIANVSARGKLLEVVPMPLKRGEYDVLEIYHTLLRMRGSGDLTFHDALVTIELQTGPPVGVKAIYGRGHARAFAWMATAIDGLTPREVRPSEWQSAMLMRPGSARRAGQTKQLALAAAQIRFPSQRWLATEKSRKPHDGMVDAALIAEYGRLRSTWGDKR